MLLEVVAKADTFVGPQEGTVCDGRTHNRDVRILMLFGSTDCLVMETHRTPGSSPGLAGSRALPRCH